MPYRTHFFLQHVTRMYHTGLVQQNAFIAHTVHNCFKFSGTHFYVLYFKYIIDKNTISTLSSLMMIALKKTSCEFAP
jgi:hypothetical protein